MCYFSLFATPSVDRAPGASEEEALQTPCWWHFFPRGPRRRRCWDNPTPAVVPRQGDCAMPTSTILMTLPAYSGALGGHFRRCASKTFLIRPRSVPLLDICPGSFPSPPSSVPAHPRPCPTWWPRPERAPSFAFCRAAGRPRGSWPRRRATASGLPRCPCPARPAFPPREGGGPARSPPLAAEPARAARGTAPLQFDAPLIV